MNTKIKIDKTCLECKTKRGKMSSVFSVYLCEDCKFEDAYILITKTNTKKNYFLTDDELVNLRAIHMDECREEAYQENVETLRAGYFPDMTVSENAEYIALKKYSNGEYPRVFPWMITTSV